MMKKHTATKPQNQTQLIEQAAKVKKAKHVGIAVRSRIKAGYSGGGY